MKNIKGKIVEIKLFNNWVDREDLLLPQVAQNIMEKHNAWKYNHEEYVMAFYKGDPETTNDWLIITQDGGAYKVWAEFMLWTQSGGWASWTYKHLLVQLKAAMLGMDIPRDPDYQS